MSDLDSTRQLIIEAAKKRFAHYGYGKTTMADLALDCDMSPGNLYRYFSSKLDIAEEIARGASIRTTEELSRVLMQPDGSAEQKLRDYLYSDLHVTYHMLEHAPKLVEMAEIISKEKPLFHNEGLKRQREVLIRILQLGNTSGEFSIADVEYTAEMIQSATMKFNYPQMFSSLTLPKLERELEGVFAIVVAGLKAGVASRDPLKVS
jgi:AcrR family transcriptional regulator